MLFTETHQKSAFEALKKAEVDANVSKATRAAAARGLRNLKRIEAAALRKKDR